MRIRTKIVLLTLITLSTYSAYGMTLDNFSGFTTPEAQSPLTIDKEGNDYRFSVPSSPVSFNPDDDDDTGYPYWAHFLETTNVEYMMGITLPKKNGDKHFVTFLTEFLGKSHYPEAINTLLEAYNSQELPAKFIMIFALCLGEDTPKEFLTILRARYGESLKSIEDIFTHLRNNPNIETRSELIEIVSQWSENSRLSKRQILSFLKLLKVSEEEKLFSVLLEQHHGDLSIDDFISCFPNLPHRLQIMLIDFLLETQETFTTDQLISLLVASDHQGVASLLSERFLNINQIIHLTSRLKFIADSNTDTRSKFVKFLLDTTKRGELSQHEIEKLLSRLKDPEAQRFIRTLRILYKEKKLSIEGMVSLANALHFMPTITTSAKSQMVSFLLERDQKDLLSGKQILSLFTSGLNILEKEKFIPILKKLFDANSIPVSDILAFLFDIKTIPALALFYSIGENETLSKDQIASFLGLLQKQQNYQYFYDSVDMYHQGELSINSMIFSLLYFKWIAPLRSPVVTLLFQEIGKGHLSSHQIKLFSLHLTGSEKAKLNLFGHRLEIDCDNQEETSWGEFSSALNSYQGLKN